MNEASLIHRLKSRKIVQWALAYLATGWAVLEATGFAAERFGWTEGFLQAATLLVVFGFFLTLTLAWYHGEKGRQRASGPELLIIALLAVIAGTGISLTRGRNPVSAPESSTTIDQPEDVAASLNRLPGIVVLPFDNLSDDSGDQYFADGIQDDLLTSLQRASGLRVTSRTSSNAYRNTDLTIRQIAQELGVDYVLEGSVRRGGDRVRINLQLIDGPGDRHLWANTYDRVLRPDSLFELQSEIVRRVYGETGAALIEEEYFWAAQRTTMDPEAYDLFARARALGQTEEALALLERAVEQDPQFVAAYAALSRAQGELFHRGRRSEERRTAARNAAEQAVALEPGSPDAQMAMGIYLYQVEKDYRRALEWLGQAAGSLRGDYVYHCYRAYVERRMGQWDESVASLQAALSLSPRDAGVWMELGSTYMSLRQYSEGEEALRESARIAPGSDGTRRYLVWLYWARDGTLAGGQTEEERRSAVDGSLAAWPMIWLSRAFEGQPMEALDALEVLEDTLVNNYEWIPKSLFEGWVFDFLGRAGEAERKYQAAATALEGRLRLAEWDERVHAALGIAYAGLGRTDDALREAQRAVELMPLTRDAHGGPWHLLKLAAVYARLGQTEESLGVLEKLLDVPSQFPPGVVATHYLLYPLHSVPGFRELIERERDRVF